MNKVGEVGEKNYNYQGYLMEIIRYQNSGDIDIKFEDGSVYTHCNYTFFRNGKIKNKNHPTVYGVGYFGYGDHKSSINKVQTKEYSAWQCMIGRCYSDKFQQRRSSYEGCSVSPEWYNFQNFAEWFKKNKWTDEILQVDKDILYKGNKIYSPETCILVDTRINNMFRKPNNKIKENENLPYGVKKTSGCTNCHYYAQLKKHREKSEYLGSHNTIEEAFYAYKTAKESYIKQVADEYKDKYLNFPQKLYNAMYNWKVEITD